MTAPRRVIVPHGRTVRGEVLMVWCWFSGMVAVGIVIGWVLK